MDTIILLGWPDTPKDALNQKADECYDIIANYFPHFDQNKNHEGPFVFNLMLAKSEAIHGRVVICHFDNLKGCFAPPDFLKIKEWLKDICGGKIWETEDYSSAAAESLHTYFQSLNIIRQRRIFPDTVADNDFFSKTDTSRKDNAGKVKKSIIVLSAIVITVLFIGIMSVGSIKDEIHWKYAEFSNNSDTFQQYMRTWPKGIHLDEAKEKIEELDWSTAILENTTSSLNGYLLKYPHGNHAENAKNIILDLKWKEAVSINTVLQYQKYLEEFPKSRFEQEVKNEIGKLLKDPTPLLLADKEGTENAYRTFLVNYPGHINEMLAKMKIAKLKGIEGLAEFLKANVDNKFSDKAADEIYDILLAEFPRENYSIQLPKDKSSRGIDRIYSPPEKKNPRKYFKSRLIYASKIGDAFIVCAVPNLIESRVFYHNIQGPVWFFQFTFIDINGIGGNIEKKRLRIYTKSNKEFGDQDYEFYRAEIPAWGRYIYESWVSDKSCDLCDGTMVINFLGNENSDKSVSYSKQGFFLHSGDILLQR